MALYVCLMLGTILCGNILGSNSSTNIDINNKKGKTLPNLIFLILWAMLAFKASFIGSDTESYIRVFQEAVSWRYSHPFAFGGKLFTNDSRYETGYVVLNRILACFTNDPQWLFIVTATFFIFVCRKFVYEKSKDVCFSIFLFIALRLFYFSMSGIRQAIAMFICLIAYRYIEKRKLVPFIVCVLLAMQFHITAIVFFLAYPISFLKFNKFNCLVLSALGIVVFFSFDAILTEVLGYVSDYYSHYTSTKRFSEGNIGNILVAVIQLLFLLLSLLSTYGSNEKNKYTKSFDEPAFMKYMMLVSILLSVVSIRATTLDRLYYYFWIFAIIYAPNVISNITTKDLQRLVIKSLVIVFTMAYNMTLLYYRPEWFNITPYKFFWN